ncbi:hypothetical protein DL765_004771 [Monosporascus sp. GIB2]|nr:hypothetical protein DL765_004771 [Monosporascus sp. GIB2]
MKLAGSLALVALMTMAHGSINVTTNTISYINMHGQDDSITWSTSSARCAQIHNAFDAELSKDHNSSAASVMSQSWRTLIYNATAVHYTKTVTLDLPGDTTTASWSSSLPRFTTTAGVHNSTINFGPPTAPSTVTSVSLSTFTGSEGVHFTVIGDQPDEGTSSHPGHARRPRSDLDAVLDTPAATPKRTLPFTNTPLTFNGLTGDISSARITLLLLRRLTPLNREITGADWKVLVEAVSQGLESVAHLQENEIKTRQQYRKALIMIDLVQQAKEKFATIDLETANQLRHLAQQKERKEEVMKEAQGALDAMDGDVFHCLSTMIDNFTAQQQYSQQPTPSEAHLPGEDQHSTTPKGAKRAATTDGPGEAPATHDTASTGHIDTEIPSHLSHRARRVRTTSPSSSMISSFHPSPERPNMSPAELPEASSETLQAQRQESGELGDTPSSSMRTRGSGRPRISYDVVNFYRELGI